MLHDLVAGLPRSPPDLTETGRRVNVAALKPGNAHCGQETVTRRETERERERLQRADPAAGLQGHVTDPDLY